MVNNLDKEVKVLETEKLILRKFNENDAEFMLELFNSPGFLTFIGDRNLRTIEDAKDHIENKTIAAYRSDGFGMWLVELKDSGVAIGTCGLINREDIEGVDIGFATLPKYMGKGYTYESAREVLNYAYNKLKIEQVVAIVNANNIVSKSLLKKLGYVYSKSISMSDGAEVELMHPSK